MELDGWEGGETLRDKGNHDQNTLHEFSIKNETTNIYYSILILFIYIYIYQCRRIKHLISVLMY